MRRSDPRDASPPEGAPPAIPSDPRALDALLDALAPRLHAVALRFVRDRDAAADVVQNALVKIWRHRHAFRGEARPSTWAHRIVANEARMWLRAEARRAGGRPRDADGDAPGPAARLRDPRPTAEAALLARERRHALRRALGTLAPDDREILLRCALGDTSYRRYARERGLHPAAVKTRAFRARHRLARALQEA